ncbi:rhodanese-like domain-containing protein [Streptomyces sp. NPDC017979]|uniref:rhodanese-like domain-containing protein n=1 Tax=Streptomyces sp. NPDC017979 TaxID=3365024 RepID=UPI0037986D6E
MSTNANANTTPGTNTTANTNADAGIGARLDVDGAYARLSELAVVDVRTPGEYAAGHLPGAVNVPLDQLRRALPELTGAAGRRPLLMVCASGARSERACAALARHGVRAATLVGGTSAWADRGLALEHPQSVAGAEAGTVCAVPRRAWAMDRQVRLTAGTLVLTGVGLGALVHPAWLLLAAGVAGGLVFSALTNTCGMAAVLAKLPHNRPAPADLTAAQERLRAL